MFDECGYVGWFRFLGTFRYDGFSIRGDISWFIATGGAAGGFTKAKVGGSVFGPQLVGMVYLWYDTRVFVVGICIRVSTGFG